MVCVAALYLLRSLLRSVLLCCVMLCCGLGCCVVSGDLTDSSGRKIRKGQAKLINCDGLVMLNRMGKIIEIFLPPTPRIGYNQCQVKIPKNTLKKLCKAKSFLSLILNKSSTSVR